MVDVMNKWISDHITFPYPTSEELAELSEKTGLTPKQIRVW